MTRSRIESSNWKNLDGRLQEPTSLEQKDLTMALHSKRGSWHLFGMSNLVLRIRLRLAPGRYLCVFGVREDWGLG